MTLNVDRLSRQLSWRGVLAGLVMGTVTTLSIMALGTVITAVTGLSLSGVGIAAIIWTALAALVGAYAAGLTAVRASAPATRNDDGIAAMTHDDATLTGLVTGGLIVLASSLFLYNTVSSLLGKATSVATGVLGTATAAAGAAGAGAAQAPGLQNFLGNISQDDVTSLIADSSPNLNKEQVDATANVVSGIIRRTQYDLGNVDLANITDFAKARTDAIKQALSGPEFVTRLERQGLSNAEATEVQTSLNKTVADVQKRADDAAKTAEQTARTTARNTGLGWLLASGLTLLASIAGARSAATKRQLLMPTAAINTGTAPTNRKK